MVNLKWVLIGIALGLFPSNTALGKANLVGVEVIVIEQIECTGVKDMRIKFSRGLVTAQNNNSINFRQKSNWIIKKAFKEKDRNGKVLTGINSTDWWCIPIKAFCYSEAAADTVQGFKPNSKTTLDVNKIKLVPIISISLTSREPIQIGPHSFAPTQSPTSEMLRLAKRFEPFCFKNNKWDINKGYTLKLRNSRVTPSLPDTVPEKSVGS